VITLQRWQDTCRAIENIKRDLDRIHAVVLPRARASIRSATERCERSNELNAASTRLLLAPAGYSRAMRRRVLVIASRP
jgi:hypothetical protein